MRLPLHGKVVRPVELEHVVGVSIVVVDQPVFLFLFVQAQVVDFACIFATIEKNHVPSKSEILDFTCIVVFMETNTWKAATRGVGLARV